jgi:hypothetical protein
MSDRAIRVESSKLINHPEVLRAAQQAAWEAKLFDRAFAR